MIFSFLMSFREMLEATMVIGTMSAILRKKDKIKSLLPLYAGSFCGMLASILLIVISLLGAKLLGEGIRNTIQGVMLIFVSITMVYFILVVEKDEGNDKEEKLQANINKNSIQVFIFSMFIVFREGIELTVVNFVNLNHTLIPIVFGTLMGMVLASAITIVTFRAARRLDLTVIFKILGVLLIIVSGLMFGEGVFKFIPGSNTIYQIFAEIGFMVPFLYISIKNELKSIKGK